MDGMKGAAHLHSIVMLAKAGIQACQKKSWIPAFAGMTRWLNVASPNREGGP